MKYWIKERHNNQTGRYYVPMGQMPAKEAEKHEKTLYGSNTMLSFDTKEEYEATLAWLRAVDKYTRDGIG